MSHKSTITEKQACEIFYKELHNASEMAIDKLKELLPDKLKNVDTNRTKTLYFYAAIYCAMLSLKEFFNLEQSERIKDLIIESLATSEDFYNTMKELDKVYSEWDEPLYKPSPEHPFESIAKYLYLKWGVPKQKIKFGSNIIDRPNLATVYIIEMTLIGAAEIWKHMSESYTIVEESSKN